jgi:hypothetical protein
MHAFLQTQLATLHQDDLRREAKAAGGRRRVSRSSDGTVTRTPSNVVIRTSTAADGPALAALSALDSAPMPSGPALVAEVSGAPRAVLPLDGACAFGDPFHRIDELVALLELRAAQIRREEAPARRAHSGLFASMPPVLRRFV